MSQTNFPKTAEPNNIAIWYSAKIRPIHVSETPWILAYHYIKLVQKFVLLVQLYFSMISTARTNTTCFKVDSFKPRINWITCSVGRQRYFRTFEFNQINRNWMKWKLLLRERMAPTMSKHFPHRNCRNIRAILRSIVCH